MPKQPHTEADKKYYRAYYLKHRERILAALKAKYQKDPDYRNRIKQKYRQRYHEDKAYHNATLERARLRAREKKREREQIPQAETMKEINTPGGKRTRKPS